MPRIVPLAIVAAVVVALTSATLHWLGPGSGQTALRAAGSGDAVAAPLAAAPSGSTSASASPTATAPTPGATASPTASTAPTSASASTTAAGSASGGSITSSTPNGAGASGLSADDLAAGLLSTEFAHAGSGKLDTVPGDRAAPGKGVRRTFRVQVERGLPIDSAVFAEFVYQVLNDKRSWGAGSAMTFARTGGPSDFRVVLASPQTSAAMCRPMKTAGTLSCRNGDAAILTVYRWVEGTDDYGTNLNGYRQYLVNHEVGHYLGHSHVACPGKGKPAPVMMQQTKGLAGCRQNPWPNP
jgi:hypothetical protein